jgi:hypothetical protein
MKLIALEIPDDAGALAGWLESHLVGLDLSALIAQLEAVHGPASARPPIALDTVLGAQRGDVLAHGLSALPPEKLKPLMRYPRLLLDLQDLVATSGGAYWNERAEAALGRSHQAAIDRGWERLTDRAIPTLATPPIKQFRMRWGALAVAALSAAAVVFAIVTFAHRPPGGPPPENGPIVATTTWGWTRPDALPQDLSRDAYLKHLADGAQAWFNKRPADPAALAQRITEFRRGCTVLIASPHRPLSAEDRAWLVEKCRAWAEKLDTHLAALRSGDAAVAVRRQTDETVNRLIAALRERSAKAA